MFDGKFSDLIEMFKTRYHHQHIHCRPGITAYTFWPDWFSPLFEESSVAKIESAVKLVYRLWIQAMSLRLFYVDFTRDALKRGTLIIEKMCRKNRPKQLIFKIWLKYERYMFVQLYNNKWFCRTEACQFNVLCIRVQYNHFNRNVSILQNITNSHVARSVFNYEFTIVNELSNYKIHFITANSKIKNVWWKQCR